MATEVFGGRFVMFPVTLVVAAQFDQDEADFSRTVEHVTGELAKKLWKEWYRRQSAAAREREPVDSMPRGIG